LEKRDDFPDCRFGLAPLSFGVNIAKLLRVEVEELNTTIFGLFSG